MNQKNKLFVILIVLLITTVSTIHGAEIRKEDYQGDGKFFVRVRDYGVGKTYGYDLQFEPFFSNRDIIKSYSFINLPTPESSHGGQYNINFEIVIGVPKSRADLEETIKRSNNLPIEHEIQYTLINHDTNEIIVSGTKKLQNLEPTHNYEFKQMGLLHMKNLFELRPNQITSRNKLDFNIKYIVNGVPTNDKMFLIVSLMAPTA